MSPGRCQAKGSSGVNPGLDESRHPTILIVSGVLASPESGVVDVVGNEKWFQRTISRGRGRCRIGPCVSSRCSRGAFRTQDGLPGRFWGAKAVDRTTLALASQLFGAAVALVATASSWRPWPTRSTVGTGRASGAMPAYIRGAGWATSTPEFSSAPRHDRGHYDIGWASHVIFLNLNALHISDQFPQSLPQVMRCGSPQHLIREALRQ